MFLFQGVMRPLYDLDSYQFWNILCATVFFICGKSRIESKSIKILNSKLGFIKWSTIQYN